MIVRVFGFLFSATMAGLLSWVAVKWSAVYIRAYSDVGTFRSPYFEPTYKVLFMPVVILLGYRIKLLHILPIPGPFFKEH